MQRDIVIIGAGVIGISCARWLQRDGHRVTVIDPQPPAHGCSHGNAGVFATDSFIPEASARILCSVPRMLLSSTGSLRLEWRDLPRLTPWLTRFVLQARPVRVRSATDRLAALCGEAMTAWHAITADRPAAAFMQHTGWATVFERRTTVAHAEQSVAERERRGWQVRWLEGAALCERIPGLSPRVIAAAEFPDVWMCTDPAAFVTHLADDVAATGGRFEQARVTGLQPGDGNVLVDTDAGTMRADHVVVAAGIASEQFARELGDRLGLAAERGYHAMLRSVDGGPPLPIMSGEHQFVTTPMAHGVRLAGTSEFARADRPPDPRRHAVLLERGRALFPGLRTDDWQAWMGCRSTTPDSLPVIGRSARTPHISYACGHQHIGLTLGGITGRLIADDLAGRCASVDLAPLRPGRFQRGSRV